MTNYDQWLDNTIPKAEYEDERSRWSQLNRSQAETIRLLQKDNKLLLGLVRGAKDALPKFAQARIDIQTYLDTYHPS